MQVFWCKWYGNFQCFVVEKGSITAPAASLSILLYFIIHWWFSLVLTGQFKETWRTIYIAIPHLLYNPKKNKVFNLINIYYDFFFGN
jgi:hypothetical protein